MKLYTEKQVRRLIEGYYDVNWIIQDAFDELTPIELPSDEEIDEVSFIRLLYLTDKSGNFRLGAKWVIEQIKQQDNEQ